MTPLQNLPQSWRRVIFFLAILVTLFLATGFYNGLIPKPPL
jgi:hypothetical protein